jgi:predicted Zn-dependent protease
MLTREEAKAVVDKVLNLTKADSVEVNLTASERSGTRWANSSITTNLVQYDRNVTVTVRLGQKQGSASTRDWSDDGLKAMIAEALAAAEKAQESRNLTPLLGAQDYLPVDGAPAELIGLGPADRARLVKASLDVAASKGVLGAGFIPKNDVATCMGNSAGLFAYFRSADVSFALTCRMPDGSGSGWAGAMGIKDLGMLDPVALTEVAANKALRSRKAKALEPGRYTVILEPRANARFLSLVTGVFQAPGGGGPGGAGGGGGGAASFLRGKKPGDKIFSDLFSLRSDVGNPILRQTPILGNYKPAAPVTWVENGLLRNTTADQPAGLNNSLVMGGSEMTLEEMIRSTRRGLLVTQLWYIRGVPAEGQPLLNTGMTRDGLFLIENGEIAGPVQNFRWNMSPLVGYNNLTLVGKPVPMGLGESSEGGNAALVPPARIEEFYMTSVSPAV